MSYGCVHMSCCGAVLYGPHAFGCEDACQDTPAQPSLFGRHLVGAALSFGLYADDEAAEMEREATAFYEEAA